MADDDTGKETGPPACKHKALTCLNQHELIRKYRCDDCQAVMMCSCDEAVGRRHLAHQLGKATELKTQDRIPVTLGFREGVCPECRGLPEVAAPAAAIHGRTSKIKRFYWRELMFEEMERFADWADAHLDVSDTDRAAAHHEAEKLALESIKALHAAHPKYDFTEPSQANILFTEPSQADILKLHNVEVLDLQVAHSLTPQKGAVILHDGKTISPEDFVTQHFQSQGWSVLPL